LDASDLTEGRLTKEDQPLAKQAGPWQFRRRKPPKASATSVMPGGRQKQGMRP
jgi:hypothetical protein